MPRLCEPCRIHTADDSATCCPSCGGPVKFTLLAPPNEAAAPMDGIAATPEQLYGKPVEILDFLRGRRPVYIGGAFVAVVVLILAIGWFRGGSFDDRVARIHVGMDATKALAILNDGNRPKPKKWKIELGATSHKDPMPDFDRPTDVSTGEGHVVIHHGGESVTLHYAGGLVTKIERGDAVRGLRKRVTVYE